MAGQAAASEAESLVKHSAGKACVLCTPPLSPPPRDPEEPAWAGPRATGFRSGSCCPFCCRYLNFYKQTMDLLTGNGIVSSQEVTLPIVSAAISHLWQTLSEESKASLLQAWAQKHSGLLGLAGACQEPACAEGSVKDSGVESQGASCSLVSTPEEVSRPTGGVEGGHHLCLETPGSCPGQAVTWRCCLDSGARGKFLIFPT